MASNIQNPSFNWNSKNLQEEWRKFRQHCDLMFAGPLNKTKDSERCAYLLIWIGDQGREIYSTWTLTAEENNRLTTLYENFERHTTPKKNTLFARYLFLNRKQEQGETFEHFLTDIRKLVKDCSYRDPEEMIRDSIVCGLLSQEIREKLLQTGDSLTMEKAVEIVTTFEATRKQLATMMQKEDKSKKEESADVEVVQKSSTDKYKPYDRKRPKDRHNSYGSDMIDCGNCGQKHKRRSCPAYGKQCSKCSKPNHFAKVCRSRYNKSVHHINEEDQYSDDESFNIDVIADGKDHPNTAYANITLQSNDVVRFKLDTGAQVNVIPLEIFEKLKIIRPLSPAKSKLFGYAGQQIDVKGCAQIKVKYKDQSYEGTFYVVETNGHSQPVLGLQACLQLQLIKMVLTVQQNKSEMSNESVLSEYKHLFDNSLGEIEGEINIYIEENSTPVVHAPRRIPHALRDRLKQELDSMEKSGVIAKVTRPTDWVNSLVVVEKPNKKLRICLDPKDLNNAVKRPHYAMPTLEDTLARIPGAKFFSKLDAKSGYWQLKLTKEASFLTTFNSPFGRYRFLRMPFGLISAQDEFQRKMDETFEGIPGVVALIDDILISGTTREEHDQNLRSTLERASEKGLKLNPEKLSIGVQEIDYFGHVISSDGIKPDPKKIKAITEMKAPNDKKELETLLGMVTYLSKFAPHLSDMTKPLRDLLKDSNDFIWEKQQEDTWQKIKDTLTSKPVLALYDPNKDLTLQVDACKSGLGAALFQDNRPIAYASKSLNTTEQNYAQIEKELYAIVFGCERFHQYLYGRQNVKVESDHKPLESIMKKPLAAAPPRLQRMLLRLQKYSIHVTHTAGKDIPVADTLSRKYLPAEPNDETPDLDTQIHCIIENMPISDEKIEQLRKATDEDKDLTILKKYINEGWPDKRQNCHDTAIDFWNFRDELSMINGIIFKGERIFVPKTKRQEMLDKIHGSHLGEEKCLQRARKLLFWTKMADDIIQTVANCQICSERRKSNTKEPMNPHEIPERPWQKVATDLFTWDKKDYIVTVDYYSRYFEVDQIFSTTSAAIIRKLSAHFARHGIPETLISDNGPQYSSDEFSNFAKQWDFNHKTSTPKYAQSNGLAEKTVQTLKNIMDKAKADKKNPLISILEYRNTPVDGLASPAQLLMGRELRSILPVTASRLRPQIIKPEVVISRREQRQLTQKEYYDRSSRPLAPLSVGDDVYVQLTPGARWTPAQIIAIGVTPRAYRVQTSDGSTYWRNRRFLRQRPSDTPSSINSKKEGK